MSNRGFKFETLQISRIFLEIEYEWKLIFPIEKYNVLAIRIEFKNFETLWVSIVIEGIPLLIERILVLHGKLGVPIRLTSFLQILKRTEINSLVIRLPLKALNIGAINLPIPVTRQL